MGHIGNTVQTAFTSFDKQTITGDGGTTYTLSHSVANEQEIEVFVNNVRQEPSVAYNVSGNTLTMTGNVASTDDFYVVFQGKAVQTASHPANNALQATTGTFSGDLTVDTNTLYVDSTNNRVGIGTSSPSSNAIVKFLEIEDATSAGLVLDAPRTYSIYSSSSSTLAFRDETASANRMAIDSSGRVTMPYQPAFAAKFNTGVNHSTDAVMVFPTTTSNIGNHYGTSTGLFTAPVAGTYLFTWNLLSNDAGNNYCYSGLQINGTILYYNQEYQTTGISTGISSGASVAVSLSANDSVGVFAFGAATAFYGGTSGNYTWWSGVLLG